MDRGLSLRARGVELRKEALMRTLLWTLGVWLFVLGPGGDAAHGVDLTRLVKEAQPAVVTVLAYDKDGRLICQGSGFCVSEKGHIITCYHVLDGAFRAEVKSFDGKVYGVESVLASDSKADLAKVLVDAGGGLIKPLEVEGAMPSIAERIVVIGSPLGLEQTVSEGIVSGIRLGSARGRSFQISASTS
jgi:serine protease Do